MLCIPCLASDLLAASPKKFLGVPNATLVKEKTDVAEQYGNKSVAEQNSVDRCWDLLMEDRFKELREQIYTTHSGLKRFRQLVVNSVMGM